MRRLLLAALLAVVAWPAGAQAAEPLVADSGGRSAADVGGRPVFRHPGVVDLSRRRCLPLDREGHARRAGRDPTRTIFEFDLGYELQRHERSPVWLGRVTATVAPGLEGAAVPGQSIRPLAATWTGGWGDERSVTVVLACPSPSRTDCEYLTNAGGQTAWGDRQVLAQHAGRYLYAVEYRTAGVVKEPALPAPGAVARPAPSALVAVSPPAGPVAADPPAASVSSARPARSAPREAGHGRHGVLLGPLHGGRDRRRVPAQVLRPWLAAADAQGAPSGRPLVRVTVDGLRLASARVRL